MSLVIWRVVAPAWMQLRRPVLAAAALAVLAPFGAFPTVTSDNDSSTYTFLALDDTIGFFAFFVVGIAVHAFRLRRRIRSKVFERRSVTTSAGNKDCLDDE